jgi:hypothetical protein
MLKISVKKLERMDGEWPGLQEQVLRFDTDVLPDCEFCGSADTAVVTVGGGRPHVIANCTSKIWPLLNGPMPGSFRCHDCGEFFDPILH